MPRGFRKEMAVSGDDLHFHYVATHGEAAEHIAAHDRFWVSDCGCREDCKRSRIDVCLFFAPEMGGTGGNFHEVDRAFAAGILKEAEEKRLVARPFRYEDDKSRTQGICFCCDDCCYYFTQGGTCDPGAFVETTAMAACTHCGGCEPACYFHARLMKEGELRVARDKCFGCGLCVDVCPEKCIAMTAR